MSIMDSRSHYSRAETVSDAVVHVSGLVLALVSVPVLITLAVFLRGDFDALLGVSVYGGALVAMITCSALYNMVGSPRWRGVLKRLDHSAIYVKIAGTYTPFTLLSGQGGWLLLGIWGAALTGVSLKLVSPDRFRLAAILLYLGLGWAGLAAGGAFLSALSAPVLVLVLTGGCLYTLGVGFYLAPGLRYHYTIWHIFVLAASFVFYAAVTVHLVQTA